MSLSSVLSTVLPRPVREWIKARAEMRYWRRRKQVETTLAADHYEYFYTQLFGLTAQDYAGKRVLDIGCGPRGSLEWATLAAERVGLDPLADSYRELGIDRHAMRYVCAPAEAIPFPDGHFDVVTSFNSLDHVDDPHAAAREMVRVLAPAGTLLLIVEAEHEATLTEPHRLPADCAAQLFPDLRVQWSERFRMDDTSMYDRIRAGDRLPPAEIGEPHALAARLTR
jgi:ubiquinone/menaquinone biosynthesis C-methylase UbiE